MATTTTRRVLSSSGFDSLASLPTLPIRKWRSLEIGAVFRILNIFEIPLEDRSAIYAILEAENGEILKVWITSIIHKELQKYEHCQGAIFIKPLGTKLSNSTGREYFDFSIVHSSYH